MGGFPPSLYGRRRTGPPMLKRLAQMATALGVVALVVVGSWAALQYAATPCPRAAAGLTKRMIPGTAAEARALMIVERPEDTTVWLPFDDDDDLGHAAVSYALTENWWDV